MESSFIPGRENSTGHFGFWVYPAIIYCHYYLKGTCYNYFLIQYCASYSLFLPEFLFLLEGFNQSKGFLFIIFLIQYILPLLLGFRDFFFRGISLITSKLCDSKSYFRSHLGNYGSNVSQIQLFFFIISFLFSLFSLVLLY